MTAMAQRPPVPRIMLTIPEAAGACGLSENLFRSEVLPGLRTVLVGKTAWRVPVQDLWDWADRSAAIRDPRKATA